jgi:hypothetical protein
MKDIFIDHGMEKRTPLVDFKVTGELRIEGRSIPENPVEFYEPLVKWIGELKKNHLKNISFSIKFEYFNTSSSKLLMQMLRMLEKLQLSGETNVKVIWYYNTFDQDMQDSGHDYQSITQIPFEFVSYSEK